MTKTAPMNGAFRLAAPIVLIAVCGGGGYGLGKISGGSAISRSAETAAQQHRQSAGPADDRDVVFATLLDPANETADIWKVVSRMPPGQIADAIRQVEAQPGYLPRKSAILSALYFHWAESDPQAALADVEALPDKETRTGLVRSVLAAWMRTDPDAAYDAVKATGSEYYGRTMLVQTWTPQSLFEGLGRHLDKHRDLLGWYCASLDDKPEARESMIGLMARQSFEDTAQFIDTMEVPADVKDRLYDQVTGEWAMKEPKQAFDAWIELGRTEVPKPLLAAMSRWSLNFPGVDESTQWVKGLAPGPVREQFKTRMIANLTNFERFSHAADLSLGLEDPRERILKGKQVRRQWQEQYPEQAKEWFASLPPEDRAALEAPLE